ncbi:delta tubulin, partial [Trypanosoma theileri]
MASVHVLVGQCGNQLGKTFLDGLVDEVHASKDDHFAAQLSSMHFRPSRSSLPHPRCVMIDMEPKVINSTLQSTDAAGQYTVQSPQYITRHSGSANNWACGYYTHGNQCKSNITEALRRESEVSGSVRTFHVLHSAAGGTGSGVGCAVADIIKSEFPRTLLFHTVIWPFASGEVVTQWYNCILTMSALRETADAVFIAHNDDFIKKTIVGRRGILGHAGTEEVSFESMNKDITQLLLDLHLPRKVYRLQQTDYHHHHHNS